MWPKERVKKHGVATRQNIQLKLSNKNVAAQKQMSCSDNHRNVRPSYKFEIKVDFCTDGRNECRQISRVYEGDSRHT